MFNGFAISSFCCLKKLKCNRLTTKPSKHFYANFLAPKGFPYHSTIILHSS